jgi:fluoride ion exporter CrcB/FEX
LRVYVIVCIVVVIFLAWPNKSRSDKEALGTLFALVYAAFLGSILVWAIMRQQAGLLIVGIVGALTVASLSQLMDPFEPGFPVAMLALLANVAAVFFAQAKFGPSSAD